jgi:hypothetical protein
MCGDVLQPPEQGRMSQAVALHLLSALVAADPSSTEVAAALHRQKLPRSLLQAVHDHAPHILLQPASKSQVGGGGGVCGAGRARRRLLCTRPSVHTRISLSTPGRVCLCHPPVLRRRRRARRLRCWC